MSSKTTDKATARNFVLWAHIEPDPNQPRKTFNKDSLQELADSDWSKLLAAASPGALDGVIHYWIKANKLKRDDASKLVVLTPEFFGIEG